MEPEQGVAPILVRIERPGAERVVQPFRHRPGQVGVQPDHRRAGGAKPVLKAVTFDLGAGIKTVQMADGTIYEEALDSSTVSKLGSVEPAAESLATFVEQVRAPRREETRAEKPANGMARN
jgi:hypothetical protein